MRTEQANRLLNNIAAAPQMRSVQRLAICAFVTAVWGGLGEDNQTALLNELHITGVWKAVLFAFVAAIAARVYAQKDPPVAPTKPESPVLTDAVDIPAGEPGFEPTQMAPMPEGAADAERRETLIAARVPPETVDKLQALRDLRRQGIH